MTRDFLCSASEFILMISTWLSNGVIHMFKKYVVLSLSVLCCFSVVKPMQLEGDEKFKGAHISRLSQEMIRSCVRKYVHIMVRE